MLQLMFIIHSLNKVKHYWKKSCGWQYATNKQTVMFYFLWVFSACYNMCDSGCGFCPVTELSPTNQPAWRQQRQQTMTLTKHSHAFPHHLPSYSPRPGDLQLHRLPTSPRPASQLSSQLLPGNHQHKPISWEEPPKPTVKGGGLPIRLYCTV